MPDKQAFRERVWKLMEDRRVARFPGTRGRIPNFVGAEAAAERLAGLDEWQGAGTLKANPDSPQLPVRARALTDGKQLYMAVPRLSDPRPFRLLDPESLRTTPRRAPRSKGPWSTAWRSASPRCSGSTWWCAGAWR